VLDLVYLEVGSGVVAVHTLYGLDQEQESRSRVLVLRVQHACVCPDQRVMDLLKLPPRMDELEQADVVASAPEAAARLFDVFGVRVVRRLSEPSAVNLPRGSLPALARLGDSEVGDRLTFAGCDRGDGAQWFDPLLTTSNSVAGFAGCASANGLKRMRTL
jgi:hypothetical protein